MDAPSATTDVAESANVGVLKGDVAKPANLAAVDNADANASLNPFARSRMSADIGARVSLDEDLDAIRPIGRASRRSLWSKDFRS